MPHVVNTTAECGRACRHRGQSRVAKDKAVGAEWSIANSTGVHSQLLPLQFPHQLLLLLRHRLCVCVCVCVCVRARARPHTHTHAHVRAHFAGM